MPTPQIVFPTNRAAAFADGSTSEIVDVPGKAREKFGDLMERTLSRANESGRQSKVVRLETQPKQNEQCATDEVSSTTDDSKTTHADRKKENSDKSDLTDASVLVVTSDGTQPIMIAPPMNANLGEGLIDAAVTSDVSIENNSQSSTDVSTVASQFSTPTISISTGQESQRVVRRESASTSTKPAAAILTNAESVASSNVNVSETEAKNVRPESLLKILEEPEASKSASSDDATAAKPAVTPEVANTAAPVKQEIVPGNPFVLSAEVATQISANTEETPPNRESSEEIPAIPPETTGISTAKQDMQMKKADKKNKIAGGTEKVLPQNGVSAPLGENLPSRDKSSVIIPLRAERAENNSLDHAAANDRIVELNSVPTEQVASVTPIVAVGSRMIERTEDMVAVHALRVRDTSNGILNVTLKPGAGLELSLELRQTAQGVEARATLQHGDYDFLNRNWADLQQRLETRGIRLAPLSGSEHFSNGNAGQFQQSHRQSAQQQDDPAFAGAFADFVMAGSFAKKTVRSVAQLGWESWA